MITLTPHSVGLFSQTQRSLPYKHSQQTDVHAPGGVLTHNSSKRAAADRGLRPRGHWDRHSLLLDTQNFQISSHVWLVQAPSSSNPIVVPRPSCELSSAPVSSRMRRKLRYPSAVCAEAAASLHV